MRQLAALVLVTSLMHNLMNTMNLGLRKLKERLCQSQEVGIVSKILSLLSTAEDQDICWRVSAWIDKVTIVNCVEYWCMLQSVEVQASGSGRWSSDWPAIGVNSVMHSYNPATPLYLSFFLFFFWDTYY